MKAEYDFSKAKRGAVIEPKGKTRITIFLDDDILSAFRIKGQAWRGYSANRQDPHHHFSGRRYTGRLP
jgi:hypothetical protein